MSEQKEKLVVCRYERMGLAHYRAAVQVEYVILPYEANNIPDEFIAGFFVSKLQQYINNISECEIQERVSYAKEHPVCPCCHKELERS